MTAVSADEVDARLPAQRPRHLRRPRAPPWPGLPSEDSLECPEASRNEKQATVWVGHARVRRVPAGRGAAKGREERCSARFPDLDVLVFGHSFTQRSRFAKFQNVPEMLRMWHTFADVRTAEDLNLPTPDLRANVAEERIAQVVIVPPTEQVMAYALQLADRAEAVRDRRVDPAGDNMLKISNDGRKAALDMRLIDGQTPIGETKIDAATNNIVRE